MRRPPAPIRLPLLLVLALVGSATCAEREPARQYVLRAQVLEVHPDRLELTIHHDDIPNLMPAMTMTYPVSERRLLDGRVPGETITATLEVQHASGRLVSITHTGIAPLPETAQGGAAGTLAVGDHVPDAAFIDQANRRRSFAEWKGAFVLLTFTETRCSPQNPCARIVRAYGGVQRAIAQDSTLAGRLRLVSLTRDPGYDTPDTLAAYASTLDANPAIWTFLTGDAITVQRFAGRFGVPVARGSGEVPADAPRTVLIDPEGRVRNVYEREGWTPAAVVRDVRAAKEGR